MIMTKGSDFIGYAAWNTNTLLSELQGPLQNFHNELRMYDEDDDGYTPYQFPYAPYEGPTIVFPGDSVRGAFCREFDVSLVRESEILTEQLKKILPLNGTMLYCSLEFNELDELVLSVRFED